MPAEDYLYSYSPFFFVSSFGSGCGLHQTAGSVDDAVECQENRDRPTAQRLVHITRNILGIYINDGDC